MTDLPAHRFAKPARRFPRSDATYAESIYPPPADEPFNPTAFSVIIWCALFIDALLFAAIYLGWA